MNTGRYVIGSLVIFVFFNLYEWAFHGLVMADSYLAHTELFRPEGEMQSMMLWMILGYLLLAFGFSCIFVKGYEGKGIGEGVRYGLYVGLAFGTSTYLINYAVFPYPGSWVAAWIGGVLLETVLAGIIISLIYKPK